MAEQDNELHPWGLPDVTTEEMLQREYALGYRPGEEKVQEEVEQAPKPGMLTAADLEEIRQAAYQEGLEQGKEEGFAQGYQEGQSKGQEDGLAQGTAQGRQEGLAQGKAEIDALAARWQVQIEALNQPLRELDQAVERQLVELTAQLAKAVVRTELKLNHKVLLASLKEAITILGASDGAVKIALPVDELELIREQYGEQGLVERGWQLLAEPDLQPGQLQVEHSLSQVEVDLHERLEMTLERFLAQLSRPETQIAAESATAATDAATPETPETAEPTTPAAEAVEPETAPANQGEGDESQPAD